MEKKKNILQNSLSNQNHSKNLHHNINIYNSNQSNAQQINIIKNNINSNKILSLRSNFITDNRVNYALKSHNSNEINFTYNNNQEKIHENIAKKYYSNNSNKSIKDMNQDTKSNYSAQSNSSSQSIKSMLNLINTGGKSSDEFSFREIKCRKYPYESMNSSKLSQEGNYPSKYMSTNYSLSRDIQNTKHKDLPNQNKALSDPQINLIIKQKIENAKINEEILLPPFEIFLDSLVINKPIKIKGQQNSCIFVNDGPILIDLENYHKDGKKNNSNNFIKFSQLRIVYNDSKVNKDKKITTLFKLHPSTFLELEDCDIGFQTFSKKSSNEKKSVAFLLSSNKNHQNNCVLNPTILNLTNTRIHNFFQSIRAGQNNIANITKSAFLQNYGKAIVMINPTSLKISESIFQNNMDNTVHVKFIDECLFEDKRKIFINKNEFENTLGNHVCVEGIKTTKLDISLVLTKNNFIKSNTDGVLVYDLLYNYFEVGNNYFKKNHGNGLNLQKSFYNGVFLSLNKNIQYQSIKIKDNQFIENKDFGLFINDCIIEVTSNKFSTNYRSGMFLCNIAIDDPKQGMNGIQNINNNINNINNINNNLSEDDFSIIIKEVKRYSNFIKNSFSENGENGLYILGYPYLVNIYENVFVRNFGNGMYIDLDTLYNNKNYINSNQNAISKKFNSDFNKLLNEFKSCPNKNMSDLTDVNINNCVVEKNNKAGIRINTCFVFCDESFIINNLEYAISIKKKEFQHCFKSGKKNVINGSIGGEWGQFEIGKEGGCFFCMGSEKFDFKKKEDIINKVPNFINESSFEENLGGKNYSYDTNKNKNNKLEKNEGGKNCDNIERSLTQSEKNKNIKKNNKNNQDNKDCCIF